MAAFVVWDYVVFSLAIILSLGVGWILSVRGKKANTVVEYLVGGRNMQMIPVVVSMIVTMESALGVVGNPVEVYLYGMGFMMGIIALVLGALMALLSFVPLYYTLGYTSVMQYINDRYDSRLLELIGIVIGLIVSVVSSALMLMAACIALPGVSAVPMWASILIGGGASTIFTALGGLKAVIWMDVFQSLVMLAGLLTVLIIGTGRVGGASKVFQINSEWARDNFSNWSTDITDRTSVWSVVIAMAFGWRTSFSTQAFVQRYNSLSTLNRARWAVVASVPGIGLISVLSGATGAVAFAYYAAQCCDPVYGGKLQSHNQILTYFVTDVINVPGLPGLFVACVFCASISSVSSHLGAMGAMTWEGMMKQRPALASMSAAKQTAAIKISVLVYGIMVTGCTFVFINIPGSIIQLSYSIISSIYGPLGSVFIVGACFRHASEKGAIVTFICSIIPVMWMSLGAAISGIYHPPLPLLNSGCLLPPPVGNMTDEGFGFGLNHTCTAVAEAPDTRNGLDKFYSIGFMWYQFFLTLIAVGIGGITTFIPGLRQELPTEDRYLLWFVRGHCCSKSGQTCGVDLIPGDDVNMRGVTPGEEKVQPISCISYSEEDNIETI